MTLQRLNKNLFQIDTMMAGRPGYCSVFLVRGRRAAVLDAGVSINAETILHAIESAGVALEEVAFIALTHAHYDHAGGAHRLLRLLQERGVQDVRIACSVKPSVYLSRADICEKLMRSGKATEGDLVGDMVPIEKDFFTILEEGDAIALGDISICALESPGHANGHLAFHVPELDFLYAGDACGLLARGEGGSAVIAPTAFAPEYTHDTYIRTLRRIMGLSANLLGFAHFGALENPGPALDRALDQAKLIRTMVDEMRKGRSTRESTLEELDKMFGEPLLALYPEPTRMRLVLKSMIAGHLHDLEREKK